MDSTIFLFLRRKAFVNKGEGSAIDAAAEMSQNRSNRELEKALQAQGLHDHFVELNTNSSDTFSGWDGPCHYNTDLRDDRCIAFLEGSLVDVTQLAITLREEREARVCALQSALQSFS